MKLNDSIIIMKQNLLNFVLLLSSNNSFFLVQNISLLRFLRVLSREAAQYIPFANPDHLNDNWSTIPFED